MGGVRHAREQWLLWISDQQSSGMTIVAFCEPVGDQREFVLSLTGEARRSTSAISRLLQIECHGSHQLNHECLARMRHVGRRDRLRFDQGIDGRHGIFPIQQTRVGESSSML